MASTTIERPVKVDLEYSNRMLVLISAPLLRRKGNGQQVTFERVVPLAVREEVNSILAAVETLRLPVPLHLQVEVVTPDRLVRVLTAQKLR